MKAIVLALALLVAPAMAEEPSLSDLPALLKKLRGCTDGWMSTVCERSDADIWVSLHSDGHMTIYFKKNNLQSIYGTGSTVNGMLRDLAAKINSDNGVNKAILDALAPLLPTQ